MISGIVPAWNEERWIGATLDALHDALRATGEEFESIVVDDGSTDATVAIAAARGARVITVARRQIAGARNDGARIARGDVLFFVDADTLANPAVVAAALAAIRGGAAGGGAAIRFDGEVPRYARVLLPSFIALFRRLRFAAGCFVYCTRDAFVAAGGFDESLYAAEEIALSRALARQGRFVVLREAVTTSARKLRANSGWRILGITARIALRGARSVKSRRGLELWYDGRRDG